MHLKVSYRLMAGWIEQKACGVIPGRISLQHECNFPQLFLACQQSPSVLPAHKQQHIHLSALSCYTQLLTHQVAEGHESDPRESMRSQQGSLWYTRTSVQKHRKVDILTVVPHKLTRL